MTKPISQILKFILMALVIIFSIQILSRILGNLELIIGAVLISLGVLAVIWTILASSNLSPKSTLKVFANSFLACSISILLFTVVIVLNRFIVIKNMIYIQYFLIFVTYFFFILVSYYIFTIGKEFGFKQKSTDIKKRLKVVKKKPKKKSPILSR